jgi:tRNA G18 (ribose-2'-O)-methylase SpoU
MSRKRTRRERYQAKLPEAKKYPISLCAVNFRADENLGYLIRAAACFGANRVYVIGHVPERNDLKASSGSLIDYVEIKQFSTPSAFIRHAENENIQVVAAELVQGARSLSDYTFNFDRDICLVVGNEEIGVPIEILSIAETVYIPMPGVGYCLNTAQTANILLYETVHRYEERRVVNYV